MPPNTTKAGYSPGNTILLSMIARLCRPGAALLFLSMTMQALTAQVVETTVSLPNSAAPRDLLYNPIGNKIYSANTPDMAGSSPKTESVSIINGATNQLIVSIPMKKGSRDFCHNTANDKVYVANYFADSVTIIDGKTDQVIGIIPVGDAPRALVYNSVNNTIYCANETSADVSVIDGNTNTVIKTVKVGTTPRVMCYNPISNKVYVPNAGSGNLTVIDGATNTVIATLKMGNVPRGIVFNPQNNRVYVSNYSSDNVSVVDGVNDSVIATIPVGDGPTAIFHNPAGNKIYCSNVGAPGPDSPDECTVSIVDASNNKVIKTLTTGDEPTAFCYASNTKLIYWANEWSHDIAAVDAVSDTFIAVVKYPGPPVTPVDICYNPLNNRIYTANRMKFAIAVIKDTVLRTSNIVRHERKARDMFYPNPVHDVLMLKKPTAYAVYKTDGTLLFQSAESASMIQVDTLPAGAYLLLTPAGSCFFMKE